MEITCRQGYGFFDSVTGPLQYVWRNKPETYSTTAYIIIPKQPEYFSLTSIEQVRFVLSFYGFTKTELASIIGISRPALYAWMDGTSEPTGENYDKLAQLSQLAHEIDPKPVNPLFHGFINRVIPGYSKSLLEYLLSKSENINSLQGLVREIYRLTEERLERLNTLPKARFATNSEILDDNLISLENSAFLINPITDIKE